MTNQISNGQLNALLSDQDLDAVAGGWGFDFGSFFSHLFGGHSAGIIGNNGAGIIGNNGAGIIGNNGAGLVSQTKGFMHH